MVKNLSNDEIRLILLDDYYNDMYIESQGKIMQHPRLEDVDATSLNGNQIYLLDKNLLDGKIEFTGAGSIAFPSRITATGVDIVEKILHASIPKLSETLPKIAESITKIGNIAKQFHALIEYFFSMSDVYELISESIRIIFENII